nr:MAG TPA: hypothetical protein [Caudoviricetes sp.]
MSVTPTRRALLRRRVPPRKWRPILTHRPPKPLAWPPR